MFIKRNGNFKFVDSKLGMVIYQFKDNKLNNVIEVNESAAEIIKLANGNLSLDNLLKLIKKRNHIQDDKIMYQIRNYINYLIDDNILQLTSEKKISEPVFGNSNLIIPTQIIIEVTKQCQLKCIHCFNSSGEKLNNEMSSNELINILKNFRNLERFKFFLLEENHYSKTILWILSIFAAITFTVLLSVLMQLQLMIISLITLKI